MGEESGNLTLNLVGSDNFLPKKRKRSKVFYGANNFRHLKKFRNKKRQLGQNRSGFGQGTLSRIKKLNTAKIKISLPISNATSEPKSNVSKAADGSTAIHFKSVEVMPNQSSKPDKRKYELPNTKTQKSVGPNTTQMSSAENIDLRNNTNRKGPWKSSLFNQNPEIPKVKQADVTTVKEDVFSQNLFSDLNLHPYLISCLEERLQLKTMTSIQKKSIPILLDNKDALIKSQTGSGKTLAYALPVIQKIQQITPEITRKDGPVALILVPTRELALQSYNLFSKLIVPFCRIVPTWIIGGENRKSEKARIRKGVNIIISTPGRILDHIQTTESLSLKNLRWIIFDEADRLLDMGFQQQIDGILKAANQQGTHKRQTVLLSATLSEKVEHLANLTLNDPVHIQLSDECVESTNEKEDNFSLPEKLTQHVAIIPSKLRLVCLVTFLKGQLMQNTSKKIMVFLSCRDSVEFHYHLLKHVLRRPKTLFPGFSLPLDVDLDDTETDDVELFQLHGGLSQNERCDVFNNFVSAKSGTLLTTGVAARGLDLPFVDWVVQYTSPGSPVDYIHRAGRTARAGRAGNTLLMLTPAEVKYISLLTQFNIEVEEMTVDDILSLDVKTTKTKKMRGVNQQFLERAKEGATSLQNQMEVYVARNKNMKTLSKTAYASFIRAYATYPTELKSIFHVKNLHLGHVAKSFGLQEAPSDIVKNLQKSVGQLPVRSSFEHREARKEAAIASDVDKEENSKPKIVETKTDEKPRLSRRQIMKNKMARKPDLMSEFSSGLDSAVLHKRSKKS